MRAGVVQRGGRGDGARGRGRAGARHDRAQPARRTRMPLRPPSPHHRGGRAHGGRGGGYTDARERARHDAAGVATDDVAVVADDTSAFFGDLTGVRTRATTAATAQRATSAAAADELPGEVLAAPRVLPGSQQTQDQVTWLQLGLCKALVRAVSQLGFLCPTPVQVAAIPPALQGKDVCARAVTGSGKTAAFLLPLLHTLLTRPPVRATQQRSKRRYMRALVLLPTRELGVQCESMLRQLLQFTTGLTVALAVGGVTAAAQEAALDAAPDIVVATPGRLVDLLYNAHGGSGYDVAGVEVIVLDECDKLLTVTLRDQVVNIVERVPAETRQMLLFSATMTDDVDQFASEYLYRPRNVDVGHVALQSRLRQQFIRITDAMLTDRLDDDDDDDNGGKSSKSDTTGASTRTAAATTTTTDDDAVAWTGSGDTVHVTKAKTRLAVALCTHYFVERVILFCRYRTTVHRLTLLFNALGMSAVELQSNQAQHERQHAFDAFMRRDVRFLVTTDVAARGLDFHDVPTVLNVDLPPTLTAYIHRVGRTARIGSAGVAVSLVYAPTDAEVMRKILAISGAVSNGHQVASVKRRDVPAAVLREAAAAIDGVFARVRAQLVAEQLEARITQAEKRYGRNSSSSPGSAADAAAVAAAAGMTAGASSHGVDAVLAEAAGAACRPQRMWCLSREERARRAAEARRLYEKEAEVTINHFQNELASLARMERDVAQAQKRARASVRAQKAREREREREQAHVRELRAKEAKKVQAGVIKKLKQRKLRQAARERRRAAQASGGGDGGKAARASSRRGRGGKSDGRKRSKKSRHHGRVKKH